MACRPNPAAAPLPWPQLAQEAQANGLGPLLYTAIQPTDNVPSTVQESLRQLYLNTALANTLALHELAALLQALSQANIPVIVLKGAALAQTVYGNVALRPMHDLDLLLAYPCLPQAVRVVAGLGFELLEPPPFADSSGLFWNELLLVKRGRNPIYLEFHWHLLDNPFYASRPDTADLFARSIPISLEGQPARILAADDLLLHLCAHGWHHHLGQWPQMGPDITRLLAHYGDSLNWQRFFENAIRYQLAYAVRATLEQLAQDWFCRLPAGTWQQLEKLRPGHKERFFIYCQSNKYLKPLRTFLALPGLGLRLRYLWGILFPAADYMARYYPTHKGLAAAYLARFGNWGRRLFGQSLGKGGQNGPVAGIGEPVDGPKVG